MLNFINILKYGKFHKFCKYIKIWEILKKKAFFYKIEKILRF